MKREMYMKTNDLLIEDAIYDSSLRHELWSYKIDTNYDVQLITVLLKLVNIDLTKISTGDLTLLFGENELLLLKGTNIGALKAN